jgi:hypothetical protein
MRAFEFGNESLSNAHAMIMTLDRAHDQVWPAARGWGMALSQAEPLR